MNETIKLDELNSDEIEDQVFKLADNTVIKNTD